MQIAKSHCKYVQLICNANIINNRKNTPKTGFKIKMRHEKSTYYYCKCLIFSGAVSETRTRDP